MLCPSCGTENRDGAKFCDECGSPLPAHCHACGTANRPGAKFCNECGASLSSQTLAISPDQPEPQPVIETAQPTSVESPPTNVPDAERRQLTVMFCDLVGSTELSGQFDPEDYRELVREYQTTCGEVVERFDCHIAQTLGDGLLIYSGYPVAHENDAERAVRVGLGILDAMVMLNERLEHEKGIRLAVRIGIHTGPVVVGKMGGEGRQEQLALGETPNVAARIQGIAQPDTIVISDATYRLIQGYFGCDVLGEHALRGVSQPIVVYRVLGDTGIQSRLEVATTRGLTLLVGRESESTLLFERWDQVKADNGQVILLSGESGIGKSRLVQVLKDHVADEPHTRMECRSLPYFTNSALYPITDFLQRMLRFQTDDTPEQKLEKLRQNLNQYRLPTNETVPLFGALLSLPVPEDRFPPLNLSPQRQRQKTLEAILDIILGLAEQQPVLFILEDLHWTDPTTLELLELLIDQTPVASIYTVLTCRPEFQPSWSHRSYLTEVTVNRLSRNQIERLAEQVVGEKHLPEEVVRQLVDKTDGVPLYVEEMTKAVLESGVLKETNGQYELVGSLTSLSIPATLQDSLMARLDRLVTAKAVAQYASVIGHQFSYELLQAVSGLNETMLQHELARLVEAELVYQRGVIPDATYIFKHALVQDTAYESLLRSTRQGYHRRIAEVLEEQFPETAENQPELLAHHYTEAAGMREQAVAYWYEAGQKASERSANVEAIEHLTKGLELLRTLPQTPECIQRELGFQSALGPVLMAIKGQAALEVHQTYVRARELCEQLGETPKFFPVLLGLVRCYMVRGGCQTACELGEQLLRLAQRGQDAAQLLAAHQILAAALFWHGECALAHDHSEQGVSLYSPQPHRDHFLLYGINPSVNCHLYAAHSLWMLGYPEQSQQKYYVALSQAQDLSHAFTQIHAQCSVIIGHQFRRNWRTMQEQAEPLMALCTEQGSPLYLAWATILNGWALAAQGQTEEGLVQMRHGLMDTRAIGAEGLVPYWLGLLAEACGQAEQTDEGLRLIAEALAVADRNAEHWYDAELHRLKAELLLTRSTTHHTEAESCFHKAISIAQNQSAKSLELGVATSLARLWQRQGKRDDARELLDPVYSWFTEGFDTADLIDAKTLLDELS